MRQQAFTSVLQHIQHLRDASHAHVNLGADICCKMTVLDKYNAAVSTGMPLIDHCHWQLYLMVFAKVLHGRIAKHAHALLVQDSVCLSQMLHRMASSNSDLLNALCTCYAA